MQNEIRIVIADDHPIVRKGLRTAIEADLTLKVVAEADDGEAALACIAELDPQVAIVDVHMPKMGGFALMRELRERGLPVEVIFLTMYNDEDVFNQALDLGAKGYVLKDSAITDIVASIQAVAAGRYYISPAISSYLVNRATRANSFTQNKPGLNDLTQTERRILRLVATQKSSKEIADELFIHYRTVENHRINICRKLDLHGNNALLKFALEHKSELI